MLRRMVSLITAALVALSAQVFALDETEENQINAQGFGYEHKIQSEEPLFMLDFEDYNLNRGSHHGFDDTSGATSYPKDGQGGGTAFAVSGSGRPYILVEPINTGCYLFSFDVRRSKPTAWFYLRMNWDTGILFDSFGLYGTQAGHNANWSIQGAKECPENQWHHVNLFLDFDKGMVYYYINNEYCTEVTGLPELNKLQFMIEGDSSQITSLDNIAMFPFTPALKNELNALGIEMPQDFKDDFLLEISSKYEGNLFTEFSDVELDLSVTNKLDTEMKYDISYYATAYNGEIVWSGEQKECGIGGTATVTHTVKPVVDRYDIYTLHATIVPYTEGSEKILREKEFSVAHVPTPGYKSDYIGACIHPGRHTTWEDVRRSIDLSGIGYLRTDFGWSGYEPEPGVYGGKGEAENKSENFYREAASDGIKHDIIFNAEYNIYDSLFHLADNAQALDALEKAAENIAREYKGIADVFELGNEWNFARQEEFSPEECAVIYKAAYRGIKRGNPEATVLTYGVSRSAADWIYKLLTTFDEPICDAVAVHLYQEAGTPESKKFGEYCMQVKDAMAKAGYPDMELWLTEGNTSAHASYSTEQQHGVNLVRQFAYCQAYDLLDKFIFYQYQTDEARPEDIESYFGIMRGPNVNNANGPKQSYMALTNYIAMTENADYEELMQYDNVWIHRYKKTDGSNVLMMYADRDCKLASLNLGANEGTLYDVNGNSIGLKSEDGKYVFSLSDQPIYFSYKGDKFERCEEIVTLDKNMVDAALGNVEEFHLTVSGDAEMSVEGNDKLKAEIIQDGKTATVKITVEKMPVVTNLPGIGNVATVDYNERRHDFGTQLYRDYVDVCVMQNGAQSALIRLPVEYDFKSADVSMKVKPYDDTNIKYWTGIVTVFNNTSNLLSGTVKITQPVEMEDMPVADILPGQSKEVTFNIPEEYGSGYHFYGGMFTTSEGEEIPFLLGDHPESYGYQSASPCAFGVIEKTKNKTPVIDGILDEAEWAAHKITDFDKSQVSFGSQGVITAGVVEQETFGEEADYGGMEDFSGTIYAQWDDRYFYTAAVVRDDVHWQKQDPVRFYYDDHFYITLAPTHTQRHDTRIDIALSDFFDSDGYTDEDRQGKIYRNWSQMFDICVGGVVPQSEDGCQAKVVRKDTVTIYEIRIPLTEIYSPEVLANKPVQSELGFNIRDYDGDRDKTYGYSGWFVLVDTKQ